MKKRWIYTALLAAGMLMTAGCGGKNLEQIKNLVNATQYNAAQYVELAKYKGIEVSVEPVKEYTEEEIDLQTKQLYFSYVNETEGITDRAVEQGDMTNIDYEGKKDGVAFEGGTAQGQTLLIGSGQFIDGFEEGLIGVMPGETVDLDLTFPENYGNAELAGQPVVFTVTVNFIPQMQDEKVSEIGIEDVKSVSDLRAYVKESMEQDAQTTYEENVSDAVMDNLMANCVFKEVPADMIAENRQTYADWLDSMAAMYGMDGKSYLEAYGMNYEDTLDSYAEQYTKQLLIMEAIADEEGLGLSDAELDVRMKTYALENGLDVDSLITENTTREDYRESFLYQDVAAFLAKNAVNTAK